MLTFTRYIGLGIVVMVTGGLFILLNLQTPTGTCASCKALLAADWKGRWYSKERA